MGIFRLHRRPCAHFFHGARHKNQPKPEHADSTPAMITKAQMLALSPISFTFMPKIDEAVLMGMKMNARTVTIEGRLSARRGEARRQAADNSLAMALRLSSSALLDTLRLRSSCSLLISSLISSMIGLASPSSRLRKWYASPKSEYLAAGKLLRKAATWLTLVCNESQTCPAARENFSNSSALSFLPGVRTSCHSDIRSLSESASTIASMYVRADSQEPDTSSGLKGLDECKDCRTACLNSTVAEVVGHQSPGFLTGTAA